MNHTDTIKALRDALESLYQMTSRYAISDTDYGIVCNAASVLALTADASEDAPDDDSDDLRPGTLFHRLHEMGNILREGGRWGGNEFEYAMKEETDVAMLDDMLTHAMQLARAARPAPVAATPAPTAYLRQGANGVWLEMADTALMSLADKTPLYAGAAPAAPIATPAPIPVWQLFADGWDSVDEIDADWLQTLPLGTILYYIGPAAPAAPIAEEAAGWIVESSHDTDFTNDPDIAAYWMRKGRNVEPLYRRGQQAGAVDGEAS